MNFEGQVYVLDDDLSVLKGISRLLRASGLLVEPFKSASSLLEVSDMSAACCLVMDIRMPGLSVEDLALELGKRGIHLPIIIITADDNEQTRQIAQRVGAVGYFRKPVDGAALLDAIKWACNSEKQIIK